MIFKQLGAAIWHYFDVICFALALLCLDTAAFFGGRIWFCLALGVSFILVGWVSELIAGQKQK